MARRGLVGHGLTGATEQVLHCAPTFPTGSVGTLTKRRQGQRSRCYAQRPACSLDGIQTFSGAYLADMVPVEVRRKSWAPTRKFRPPRGEGGNPLS